MMKSDEDGIVTTMAGEKKRKGRMECRGLLNDQLINRLMVSIRGREVVVEEKKRGA